MSHAISGVDNFDTVTVPDDGEVAAASAPGVPASRVTLEEVVQNLANREEWLKINLNGHLESHPRIRTVLSTAGVYCGPISSLILGDRRLSTSVETLVAYPIGSANGWKYLYAYNNSGAVGFEVSTTAPAVGLVFKTGDTTRRFLGSFFWVSGIGPADSLRVGRRIWSHRVGAVQSTVGAMAKVDYVLTGLIPPHVSLVRLRVKIISGAGILSVYRYQNASAILELDSTGSPFEFAVDVDINPGSDLVIEHETSGTLSWQYTAVEWEE